MKTCTRCGRRNQDAARYCDQCAVVFPPLPPVPEPTNNSTKEISRFWLALAFVGATLLAAYLKLPDLLVGILGGGATSASSYYFGEKLRKK